MEFDEYNDNYDDDNYIGSIITALEITFGEKWLESIVKILNEYDESRTWESQDNDMGVYANHIIENGQKIVIGYGENAKLFDRNEWTEMEMILGTFNKFFKNPSNPLSRSIFGKNRLDILMKNRANVISFFSMLNDKDKKLITSYILIEHLETFYKTLSRSWELWFNDDRSCLNGKKDPVEIWFNYATYVIGPKLNDIQKLLKWTSFKEKYYDVLGEYDSPSFGFQKLGLRRKCQICLKDTPKYQCSACKLVSYCNDECQKEDWIAHKSQCIKLAAKIIN